MSSIFPQLGREVSIHALGRSWKCGRMSIDILERFVEWARPQLPDPFEGLKDLVPHLTREDAMALIKEARAERRAILDYNSPFIQEMTSTLRGAMHLFLFLLQVNHPDVSLGLAGDIAAEIGDAQVQSIFLDSSGRVPSSGKGQPQEEDPLPGNLPTGNESANC